MDKSAPAMYRMHVSLTAVIVWIMGITFWCSPEILLGSLVVLVFYCWKGVSEKLDELNRQWFFRWLLRGLVVPLLVWVAMNVGRNPFMPPLTRWIGTTRPVNPFQAFWWQFGLAAMVIVSCWAAGSFIWFMTGLIKRAKNTEDLLIASLFWSPVLLLVSWGFWEVCGLTGIGFAAVLWAWPLTQYCLTIADFKKPPPSYSAAIGKIKFGKYSEAEMHIIGQLEKSETDFDGWMMLAELYAHHFKDLKEAEKTIYDVCADPNTTLSQVSMAFHRLADWHLNLCENPAAARRVLEDLCTRMPGTHLEVMARNRIKQLPGSSQELYEQRNPRPVAMPVQVEEIGETHESSAPQRSPEDAMIASQRLVEALKADPNDTPSREKLARIFAGELGQIDLAVEQLELLLGMSGQPALKSAEWLALMARWRLQQPDGASAAREIMERLICDYPQTPHAFAAQRRLSLMKAEARIRHKGSGKSMAGLG